VAKFYVKLKLPPRPPPAGTMVPHLTTSLTGPLKELKAANA
jgi:hypothetical protein